MQYSYDTESALLGAGMKRNELIDECAAIVKATDFYSTTYAHAWQKMIDMRARGLNVDEITLGDALESAGILQNITNPTNQFYGRAALSWMTENTNAKNAVTYAIQIKDFSIKREAEAIFTQGVNWSRNGRHADAIIADAMKMLSELTPNSSRINVTDGNEAISAAYDHAVAAMNGKISTVQTGLIDLDSILGGGLIAPEILVVAARPGNGKTALITTIAKNAAARGKKVLFFSLEMSSSQIGMRLMTMETGIPYGEQKSGRLASDDWINYTAAVERISGYIGNLTICDTPAITANGMIAVAQGGDYDMIIMDYIQLGGTDEKKFQTRDLQIAAIMQGLKLIAKRFNVPIIAAAQLSRAVDQRADKKPTLSDLRESGSIENDADAVMFLYHPDENNYSQTSVIFGKNRNGELGTFDLYFDAARVKFNNAVTEVIKF